MSQYEQAALEGIRQRERKKRNSIATKVGTVVSKTMGNVRTKVERTKIGAKVFGVTDSLLNGAMEGLYRATFVPMMRSVRPKSRIKRAARHGLDITTLDELRNFDLEAVDKGAPRVKYNAALMAESAASSLAVTGTMVSQTVSGGATVGVVVAAIAADSAATIAMLGRSVARIAVHYGFDPRSPEEERYMFAVLNFSTASSQGGKVSALSALSRLTNQMMRRATWKELEGNAVVAVIQQVFKMLGYRLTHRRLAQAVPVAGVAINMGLSWNLMDKAITAAMDMYRLRYLAGKYDFDLKAVFEDLIANAEDDDDHEAGPAYEEVIIDVDDFFNPPATGDQVEPPKDDDEMPPKASGM